jgi:hypothetical protein
MIGWIAFGIAALVALISLVANAYLLSYLFSGKARWEE